MMFASDVGHLPGPIASQALVQSFVAPPGKVCLLYGDKLIFHLSLLMNRRYWDKCKPKTVGLLL